MSLIDDFFSDRNTVFNISHSELKQTLDYLGPIRAFARITYKSIYVIDYHKKGFEYVSENPLFLCGHTAEEIREMGYGFYFKYVTEKDVDLLLKINEVGFNFYEGIPIKDRMDYTISYDFQLRNDEGKVILINQKLTPLFLTDDGKIWKAICIIALSNEQSSGNIKIYKHGGAEILKYNLDTDRWESVTKIELTDREREILQFSARGYTIKEVADILCISIDTIKFHRRKLFEKLEVANISEAIIYATNNELL